MRIGQIGLIVENVEEAARAWADVLGLPMPEIDEVDTVDVTQAEYEGEPTTARAKLAFFKFENIDVELIEPLGEPSTWNDQYVEHGNSIHHLAFRIKGMQEKLAYLKSKGIPLIQRGEYTGGRYAYTDAVDSMGMILELLEHD
jgi:catechol 2,3-dioxygenase-like lactoylglutathione lyase family enzyme